MLLTPKQAIELATALLDSVRRADEDKQEQLIVCTPDRFSAVPFTEKALYNPDADFLVF